MLIDANEKLDHFNEYFFQALERHAFTRKKEKEIRQRHCPFADKDLCKKDQANKIANATGSAADCQNYRDKVKKQRVKRSLLEAERNYVKRAKMREPRAN